MILENKFTGSIKSGGKQVVIKKGRKSGRGSLGGICVKLQNLTLTPNVLSTSLLLYNGAQSLSTGDLRILPDLLTFYGRKVGKFTAVNRPIYGNLFTGSRYKKRRKLRSIAVKNRKTQ